MTPAAAIRAALGDEVRDLVVWLDPGGRCVHVAGCSTLTEGKASTPALPSVGGGRGAGGGVMIAALFVQRGGVYYGLDDVDPWDESRDARLYDGPHPVVAHPPCERWGRYWGGGPMLHGTDRQKTLGDDAGCFASALASVRRWGGVLEHPEASHAWAAHGLVAPPRWGGWMPAGDWQGWTCCVEQGHYGHRARKATWLYACGVPKLPRLRWGPSEASIKLDDGFHSAEERRRSTRTGAVQRMGKAECAATPLEFRDVLLSMARSARNPAI